MSTMLLARCLRASQSSAKWVACPAPMTRSGTGRPSLAWSAALTRVTMPRFPAMETRWTSHGTRRERASASPRDWFSWPGLPSPSSQRVRVFITAEPECHGAIIHCNPVSPAVTCRMKLGVIENGGQAKGGNTAWTAPTGPAFHPQVAEFSRRSRASTQGAAISDRRAHEKRFPQLIGFSWARRTDSAAP